MPKEKVNKPRKRQRRSSKKRSGLANEAITQLAWQLPRLHGTPIEPITQQAVHDIHDTAMRILEEIGMDFLNDDAINVLKRAGCDVTPGSQRVRMDRDFVMAQVSKAPSLFNIVPRNRAKRLKIGSDFVVFGSVGSPPSVSDLEGGRRDGNRKDFCDLLRLCQYFNCIHFISGYPVEPIDIHPSVRHLDAIYDKLTLCDKVIHIYALGSQRVEDGMEMVRIASGLSHEQFEAGHYLFTNINSTSPLRHDWSMLDGAMRMARRNQPVIITPFTLAGATAPITLAGALAQQTAETLGAVALLQCIRPGVPVVMGGFTTNVDMKSGAPAFGTPEYMRAMQITGQMARFYNLPARGSNANAANFPDAQAAWESVFSLWGVITGNINMIYHGAGWMEGGLCASFEKFIIDCEMLQQVISYLHPVEVDDASLAFDVIKEVDGKGHYFGVEHTRQRYADEFYQPFLSDWRNYEVWRDDGRIQAHQRANVLYQKILRDYQRPAIDPAIEEELTDFVKWRKSEGGVPTDF